MKFTRTKTVIITGASSGVGRAAALEFARNGYNLVIAARGKAALEKTAEDCRMYNARVVPVITDTSQSDDVENLVRTATQEFGEIDCFINNAGVLGLGVYEEMPAAVIDQIIKTNLLGYMHGAHSILPVFKKQGYGVLINNISVGGWLSLPYGSAYSASKFGLRGFVESLQGELSAYPDIHIVALYPGFQSSPGIEHAANYFGVKIKTPPPYSHPDALARSMVDVAENPVDQKFTDLSGRVFKLLYATFPGLTRNITALALRKIKDLGRKQQPTPGNVVEPVKFKMQKEGDPIKMPLTGTFLLGSILALSGIYFINRLGDNNRDTGISGE